MQERLDSLAPVIFAMAFMALWAWESLSATRPKTSDTPRRRRRNLAISALNFLIGGAGAGVLLAASIWVAQFDWGLAAFARLPQWLIVLAGVLLIDLTDYVRHRLSHRLQLLWRLQTDTNYGTALTIWDRMLGTFHRPVAMSTVGLDGFDNSRHQSIMGMLSSPWRAAAAHESTHRQPGSPAGRTAQPTRRRT